MRPDHDSAQNGDTEPPPAFRVRVKVRCEDGRTFTATSYVAWDELGDVDVSMGDDLKDAAVVAFHRYTSVEEFLQQERDEDDGPEPPCGASFTTGGHDPYGTSCELPPGHTGRHRGHDPFGSDKYVSWSGGGSCGGDPLPYREVEWLS